MIEKFGRSSQLWHLIMMQLRVFFREPGILFWAFGFPLAIALVLGIAFTRKEEVRRNAGYISGSAELESILSKTALSREGSAYIIGSPGSKETIRLLPFEPERAVQAVKRGEITIFLSMSKDSSLTYYFDPLNTEAMSVYQALEISFSRGRAKGWKSQVSRIDVPGSRYIDFLIPGLLALSVMNSCLWGVSWSLIELRMKKLLRSMIASSMNRALFLVSFFFTRLIIMTVEAAILAAFAYFYFGLKMQGSLPGFVTVVISGLFAFWGIAVLLAARAANSQVGNGLINAVTMPMMILSGVFFSYHNFPDIIVPVVQMLPLTLLADAIRSVYIEGAGFFDVLRPSGILVGIGGVCALLGARFFRWY